MLVRVGVIKVVPVPKAENEPYVVKSPEELSKVSLGVVPSTPKKFISPPLIVRSPVEVSTCKVVLIGSTSVPPLVMVKNC